MMKKLHGLDALYMEFYCVANITGVTALPEGLDEMSCKLFSHPKSVWHFVLTSSIPLPPKSHSSRRCQEAAPQSHFSEVKLTLTPSVIITNSSFPAAAELISTFLLCAL